MRNLSRKFAWHGVALLVLTGILLLQFPATAQESFDHFSTGFELDGAHVDVDCERCHVNATFVATSPMDEFTVLPMQIFNWTSRPQQGFIINAAAAIIILLIITFILNGVAIYLRNKWQKKLQW